MSAQTDIKDLLTRGTRLSELPDRLRHSNLSGMAGMSIRAGLRAYFSTYSIAGVSNVLAQVSKSATGSESLRLESRPDYVEAYTETILHFHFGIELAIKELLRQKHPLLASSSLPEGAVLWWGSAIRKYCPHRALHSHTNTPAPAGQCTARR